MPLASSRFASLHPHGLLACGYRCFPSLGFELPALTNRCRTASPAPSALRPSGERCRPGARAGRRRGGSLRRTVLPNGRARSSRTQEDNRQGSPFSSRFLLQPCGHRRPTQPTIRSAPASFLPPALLPLRCLARVRFSRLGESPLSSLLGAPRA